MKQPTVNNRSKYTLYKNKLTTLLRTSKQQYYYNIFQKYKNDYKKTWLQINDILGKNKNNTLPSNMYFENTQCHTRQEIVESFNSYFVNIGKNISRDIPDVNNSFNEYLKDKNDSTLFLKPTSVFEIIKYSNILKPHKASGPDDISPRVVKESIHSIVDPLCDIFNKSISSGIIPDRLKIAKIIPIYKKNDKENIQNYRPIALLPIFSKLFEKILHQRIYDFFVTKKLLIDEQFGFRKNYSTCLGALNLTDYVIKNIDKGNYCLGVFMDLSKAFDTIDHHILLRKLYHYGIRGLSLKLFENYLSNRKQYVVVDGVSSSYKEVTCGVPQGSVLGPLLFLIYINDIKQTSNMLNFSLFADDTSVIATHSNIFTLVEMINEELVKLNNWFRCNKLLLNYEKTNYMIFRSRNRRIPDNLLPVCIDNNIIHRKESIQFLGIILDEFLNWKHHINHISLKLSRSIGVLSRLKCVLPSNILFMLYNSIIVPHLNYCNIIWGNTFKSYLDKIYLLQKRAIRIVTKSEFYSSSRPLFVKLQVLPIQELIKFHTLTFMYKFQTGLLPSIPNINFVLNNDIHSHSTRQSNNIHLPYVRSTLALNSFYAVGIKEWNCLKNDIKESLNLSCFKRLCKQLLINDLCTIV